MKSDLDELIEHYEAQAKTVEQDLQECLLMQDYLGAHDYSRALNLIKNELNLLHNLKDPLYDDKLRLENLDKNIDYLVMKFKHPKEYWQKKLEGQKLELQQLIEKGKVREFVYDSQEIDDALFNLHEGKIKGFKLYLKKEENFYFEFKLSAANILEILVEANSLLNNQNTILWNSINWFKKSGFKLDDEEKELSYHYDMTGFKSAVDIKILLASIIFKVFNFSYLKSTYLRIY